MKKWDLIHDSFPCETISDYMTRKSNKVEFAYCSIHQISSDLFNKSVKLKDPSKQCKDLKAKIVTEYSDCFKEKLGPNNRMSVENVKLRMKEGSKQGLISACVRMTLHIIYATHMKKNLTIA